VRKLDLKVVAGIVSPQLQ